MTVHFLRSTDNQSLLTTVHSLRSTDNQSLLITVHSLYSTDNWSLLMTSPSRAFEIRLCVPKIKIVKISVCFYIGARSLCTDQGYTRSVNHEASINRTGQAFNELKESISGCVLKIA